MMLSVRLGGTRRPGQEEAKEGGSRISSKGAGDGEAHTLHTVWRRFIAGLAMRGKAYSSQFLMVKHTLFHRASGSLSWLAEKKLLPVFVVAVLMLC